MPDLADDVVDRVQPRLDALLLIVGFSACSIGRRRAHFAHPGFQPVLQTQAADDPAGDDRDAKAEAEIGQRHPPADQAEQQAERHLVHHRRGDQEGEGDAKRHAGGDEADEQRHGGAGAERRDDAERRGQHIADTLAPAGQQARVRSGEKKLRTTPMANTTSVSSSRTFGVS